jgi:glycosyltransferase involved in cell wall biosynthesis
MENLNILLWAVFGASNKAYWGPGSLGYRMYELNKDRSVQVYLAHGNREVDMRDDIFADTYFISNFSSAGAAGRFLYSRRGSNWVEENGQKFDVFHGLGVYENTFTPAWHFCRKGKPAFLTLTGYNSAFTGNSKVSLLLGQPQRRLRRANDLTGYIAISKAIADMLQEVGIRPEKIFRIPNSVNTEVFHPVSPVEKQRMRSQLGLKERLTVIFVGGLCRRKRPLELVQACASIIKKGIEINLVVLGPEREPGYKQEIQGYIAAQQLQDYIHLVDFSTTPENYFQCADIYVLASREEGMAGALLEGMATGLPCVVTKISGSEDLIQDGFNGLYTDGQVDDIAARLLVLIQEETFRLKAGQRCRELILDDYSTQAVLQNYLTLFREYSRRKTVHAVGL